MSKTPTARELLYLMKPTRNIRDAAYNAEELVARVEAVLALRRPEQLTLYEASGWDAALGEVQCILDGRYERVGSSPAC